MDFDVIKAILSKKEDFLRRHLVLSTSVINKLRQMDVIGKYTRDQMLANKTDVDKQMTLLSICLRTRGLPAFQGFLHVLRMTFHGWLADDILDTSIDIGGMSTNVGNTIAVRDILNQMYQNKVQSEQFQYKPIYLAESEYPYVPYFPKGQGYRHEPNARHPFTEPDAKRQTRSEHQSRRHEYTSASNNNEVPLSEQVPENLRYLQTAFDSESAATRKSISVLRQEEITIKALLQNNLREQQDLLSRQQALEEIKDKIKELNRTATQLYRPEPDVHVSKKRLKHLQRIPWTDKD
ncbi:uncharacterized protein LOC128558205 [Mercenaria mercenaria]|uniref:uncharacterized protein LOC128558205 n=1 Tax=Mercenaria mercenaria TaxID=6596 RepID=UPI00234EE7D9|nr:uncharacterized protein LOC128558205 [Mercenaria mercenaria]